MKCFSCGADVPDITGPTHPYMLSSPGCWKLYGDILAKEYSQWHDPAVHRLTVDSYAATHPGDQTDPRALRSGHVHLLALYAIFERGYETAKATAVIAKAVNWPELDQVISPLSPPSFADTVHVNDVVVATTAEQHKALVTQWATSVWQAWQPIVHDDMTTLFAALHNS